jgi:hypothetical protein
MFTWYMVTTTTTFVETRAISKEYSHHVTIIFTWIFVNLKVRKL